MNGVEEDGPTNDDQSIQRLTKGQTNGSQLKGQTRKRTKRDITEAEDEK